MVFLLNIFIRIGKNKPTPLLDNHNDVNIILKILLKYIFFVKQNIILLVPKTIQAHKNFTNKIDCFDTNFPSFINLNVIIFVKITINPNHFPIYLSSGARFSISEGVS